MEKQPNPEDKTKTQMIRGLLASSKFQVPVIVLVSFGILFDLSMALALSPGPYIFAIILFYIVLVPFLALIQHAYAYILILPAPCLGSWAISMMYLTSTTLPVLWAVFLASIVPVALTTSTHLLSRNRNLLGGQWRPVSTHSFGRALSEAGSSVFLVVAPYVLLSPPLVLDVYYKTFFYSILIVAYCMSNMLYVNSKYRYRILCNKLNIKRIEPTLRKKWERIEKKFPEKHDELDLLRYSLVDAFSSFEEGRYETAFISGYKVIREQTVVDPISYVSDKRVDKVGEPSSFCEIRAILMHSRRDKTEINVKRIRETKRKLPEYCLELLPRGYKFVEELANQAKRIEPCFRS